MRVLSLLRSLPLVAALLGCTFGITPDAMPPARIIVPESVPETDGPVFSNVGQWCLTNNGGEEPLNIEAIGVQSQGPAVSCRALEIWSGPSTGEIRGRAPGFAAGSADTETTVEFSSATGGQPVVSNDHFGRTCFRIVFSASEVTARPNTGTELDPLHVALSGTRVAYGIGAGATASSTWADYRNALHIRARGARTGRIYKIASTTSLMGPTHTIRASRPTVVLVRTSSEEPPRLLSSVWLVNGRRETLISWNVSSGLVGNMGQKVYVFETYISRPPATGLSFGQMRLEENGQPMNMADYKLFEMRTGADLYTTALGSFGATSGRDLVGVVFSRPRVIQNLQDITYAITAVPHGGRTGDVIQTSFWRWSGEQTVTGRLTPDTFRSMAAGGRLVGPFIQASGMFFYDGMIWTDFPANDDGTGPNWAGGHLIDDRQPTQLRQFEP